MAVDKVGPNMKTVIELAQLINPEDASVSLTQSFTMMYVAPQIDFNDINCFMIF